MRARLAATALLTCMTAVTAQPSSAARPQAVAHLDGMTRAATATAETGKRCRAINTEEYRIRVTVDRGRVRCRTARSVVRRYFNGEGVKHGGPSNAETYYQIGRWRCGPGAGGVGCIRRGTTWNTARDRILGEALPG